MNYEEALKIADSILNNPKRPLEIWQPYLDEMIKEIADELMKAFEFGVKW